MCVCVCVCVYVCVCCMLCMQCTMDLIRNDIIIDKMAVFSVGTSYAIAKMSFVCGFHDMELFDNKGKRLVSMMWQCKMVPPDETRLKLAIDAKPHTFVL